MKPIILIFDTSLYFSITQNYICFRYDDSLSRYMEYDIHNNNNNETPAAWFVRELKDLSIEIEEIFEDQKPMLPLTLEQQNEHNNATICHICEDESRSFDHSSKTSCKVYDHCHLTGITFEKMIHLFLKRTFIDLLMSLFFFK